MISCAQRVLGKETGLLLTFNGNCWLFLGSVDVGWELLGFVEQITTALLLLSSVRQVNSAGQMFIESLLQQSPHFS